MAHFLICKRAVAVSVVVQETLLQLRDKAKAKVVEDLQAQLVQQVAVPLVVAVAALVVQETGQLNLQFSHAGLMFATVAS